MTQEAKIIDWENPTDEGEAALNLAVTVFRMHRPRGLFHGLHEMQMAEWVAMTPAALFYSQAKNWSTQPPPNTPPTWPMACAALCSIIEAGYDPEARMWWNLHKLFPDQPSQLGMMMALADLGFMIDEMRQKRPELVSRGFELFIDIILGPKWRPRYKAAFEKLRAAQKGATAPDA